MNLCVHMICGGSIMWSKFDVLCVVLTTFDTCVWEVLELTSPLPSPSLHPLPSLSPTPRLSPLPLPHPSFLYPVPPSSTPPSFLCPIPPYSTPIPPSSTLSLLPLPYPLLLLPCPSFSTSSLLLLPCPSFLYPVPPFSRVVLLGAWVSPTIFVVFCGSMFSSTQAEPFRLTCFLTCTACLSGGTSAEKQVSLLQW